MEISQNINHLMGRDQSLWILTLMSLVLMLSVNCGKSQSRLNTLFPHYVIELVEAALEVNYFSAQVNRMAAGRLTKHVNNDGAVNQAGIRCDVNSQACEDQGDEGIVPTLISKGGIARGAKKSVRKNKRGKTGEVVKFNALNAEYVGI
ncbi:MAG: hypothetical protein QM496_19385 [Verrucomicrobiota bacterium]